MARPMRTRIVGWIAVCAVMLNAFLPVVSHKRVAEGAFAWADVCTTDGVKRVAKTDAPTGDKPANSHWGTIAHCSYCCSHPASHGAPPPDGILLIAVVESQPANAPTGAIVRTLPHWRTPQSRAPPLIS